jgi:hypothetical protein
VDGESLRADDFRADAAKCAGLVPVFWELLLDDEMDAFTRRRLEPKVQLLTGLFWSAGEILVDELFEDLTAMNAGTFDAKETMALHGLPEQFEDRFDGRFLHQFLVATVVVTTRVATAWEYPATVAEALAVKLLLDRVEVLIDTYELDLDEGWRENVEGILFEDEDHELLYWDPSELQAHPRMMDGAVNLDYGSWFLPFNTPPRTAPYSVTEPREA